MKLSIDDLKESNDFLNEMFENVTSAIFLADSDARIFSFNDSFRALFYKPEDGILRKYCGNAMGCVFVEEEGKDCGSTSNCSSCALRRDIVKSLTEKVPVYRDRLERDFVIEGFKLHKDFIFTTKYVIFGGVELVLVIVDDVSDFEEAKRIIEEEKNALFHELQHRVGNNLQMLSSLVSLQVDTMGERRSLFPLNDFRCRLATLRLAYETAINVGMEKPFSLGDYILGVSRELSQHLGLSRAQLEFVVEADDVFKPIEIALPLGLICAESILENARHFRCPGEGRKIVFRLTMDNRGGIDLVARAIDSSGYQEERRSENGSIEAHDLGSTIANALASQLHASLSWHEDASFELALSAGN